MVICITFTSVVGELVPKRIALSNPEKIASVSAPLMKLIAGIAKPAVRLLSFSTNLVIRILKIRNT